MKTSNKLLATIMFSILAMSCGTTPPRAIPVNESGSFDGFVNGLRNVKQVASEGRATVEEFISLGELFRR